MRNSMEHIPKNKETIFQFDITGMKRKHIKYCLFISQGLHQCLKTGYPYSDTLFISGEKQQMASYAIIILCTGLLHLIKHGTTIAYEEISK